MSSNAVTIGSIACVVAGMGVFSCSDAQAPLPTDDETRLAPTRGADDGPYVASLATNSIVSRAGLELPTAAAEPLRQALARRARPRQTVNGTGIDWNVATGSAVSTAPATYAASWTTSSNQDAFYFAVGGTGNGTGITNTSQVNAGWVAAAANGKIFKLSNLYGTKPDLRWYALDGVAVGFANGAIAINTDGTKVFALSTSGRLYCFAGGATGPAPGAATPGTACTGWPAYPNNYYSAGTTTAYSAPWYDWDSGDVYFGDTSGKIHRVSGTTGASAWSANGANLGNPTLASVGSPIVVDGVLYVGDDVGRFFRVINLNTLPAADGPNVASLDLCATAPGTCATNPWAIRSSPTMDYPLGRVYAVSGGSVFEFPAGSTANWQPSSVRNKVLLASATLPGYSAPALDWAHGYLYVGYNSRLYKVEYPFAGSSSQGVTSTLVEYPGGDASYPRGMPLPFNSTVYLASQSRIERYGCTGSADTVAPVLSSVSTLSYGTSTVTPLILDYRDGNINFGYSGGVVQYKQQGTDWVCPASRSYSAANLACGTNPKCISGACTNNASCSATHVTRSCNAGTGLCVGACSAGYGDCNGDKNTDGCETSTTGDIANCGACGAQCSQNHMATITCTNSVCGGTCEQGYGNCNGLASDGCETATSCTSCCGGACAAGKVCGDTGCVTGGNTVCVTVSEHQTPQIVCPGGTHVTTVNFASYGTPTGACSSFAVGSCNAATSTSIVQTACLGKTSCSVAAENGVFGDPCSGTFKRLYIQVTCSC